MSTFSIKQNWIANGNAMETVASVTYARVQMFIGRRNITEHKTGGSKREDALVIPTYYLAEWIAENWWVLLFEPRKDDERDDTDYLTRHSLIAAQGGFPLPNLSIVPTGRGLHLNCSPRIAPYAKAKFTADVFADVARDEVEKVLSTFVDNTVKRLSDRGHAEVSLSMIWAAIKSMNEDERRFCELVGSLGTFPGDATETLTAAIKTTYNALGFRATRDLCLAATADELQASVGYIDAVTRTLEKGPEAVLAPLLKADLPLENYNAPSHRRGSSAAKKVREHLRVDIKNPNVADILFEQMKINPADQASISHSNGGTPFSGAIAREDGKAKIALLQPELLPRRFGAARAAYLAWVSEANAKRLVTNAVTRDQQASRAFAAEILIPQAYLRSLAGPKNELHPDQVREAARSRKVMPDVAFKQANNAGIRVHHI